MGLSDNPTNLQREYTYLKQIPIFQYLGTIRDTLLDPAFYFEIKCLLEI